MIRTVVLEHVRELEQFPKSHRITVPWHIQHRWSVHFDIVDFDVRNCRAQCTGPVNYRIVTVDETLVEERQEGSGRSPGLVLQKRVMELIVISNKTYTTHAVQRKVLLLPV